MAALKIFFVSHGGIRIKVRALPTMRDLKREYEVQYVDGMSLRRAGRIIEAFFAPTRRTDARHIGTIVLPLDGNLHDLIPHEVTHAVMHKLRFAHCADDEALANAVGVLSAKIARKIETINV